MGNIFGSGRGAHARGAAGSDQRLRALSERMSIGTSKSSYGSSFRGPRWSAGIGVLVVGVVVVALVVFVAVQLLRGVPAPTMTLEASALHMPGTPPSLPWPTSGQAAMVEIGAGSLGHSGTGNPVPVASIAKVLTAYQVLKDHPLSPGQEGPSIPVDAPTLAEYQAGLTSQQSEVPVTAGESLTEFQALEALLVASGNDAATLLADFDAGSVPSFVAKLNATAARLGLRSTHITDPSGLDAATVSTPDDLIQIGELAMASPVFAQIVAMPSISLPGASLIYNFDYDIGHEGIVGIKTGSDAAAGGCFLFEADETVDSRPVTFVGAVLGEQTPSILTSALNDAKALIKAATAAAQVIPVVAPGQVVATIHTAWGSQVPVVAGTAPTIVGWPGLTLDARLVFAPLHSGIVKGERVGTLVVSTGTTTEQVPLIASADVPSSGIGWKLTHL
ncbi:MAG: D-alanyl-D-alanine carboxypeptidase family protein [Acidimicrobiales bacterium]